jgi:hypothetical protein
LHGFEKPHPAVLPALNLPGFPLAHSVSGARFVFPPGPGFFPLTSLSLFPFFSPNL